MARNDDKQRVHRYLANCLRSVASGLCFVTLCALSAQAGSFDRNAWLGDYAALKAALEKQYSNLAWFGSPESGVDLPALDRRTLAALEWAKSDEDARSAILSFVRSFHDGHFSELEALAPPTGTKSATPGDTQYSRQDAAGGCAALGDSSDGSASFSVPFERLPGFHLVSDGLTQPFRVGVLTGGDPPMRLGMVRIRSFETDSPTLCMEAWKQDAFWNQQGKLLRGALRQAVTLAWYRALADQLRRLKSDGATAVLVDVGDNSGGDDSGDIAARLLTAKPLHSAPLWMSQDKAASAQYFDEQLAALRRALQLDPPSKEIVEKSISTFSFQKEKLTQIVCPMDWVWRERRTWNSEACRRLTEAGSAGGPLAYLAADAVGDARVARLLHWPSQVTALWGAWTGPVYVLTNGRTYSAAEMFAAVLQNNRAAKTIGSQTGGDGCGFMNDPDPVVLPYSRLRFRIPNCVRMRADGTDEVAGVKPDLPVLPTEGENKRTRAMRVFSEVYADLKQSSRGQ
jgi:hypothetical protein